MKLINLWRGFRQRYCSVMQYGGRHGPGKLRVQVHVTLACAAFAAACENNGEAPRALQEILGKRRRGFRSISSPEEMLHAVKEANASVALEASPIGLEVDGHLTILSWSAGGRAAVRLALGTEEGVLILSSAQPELGAEWGWRSAALRRAEAAILAAEDEMKEESDTLHTEGLALLRKEADEEAEGANAASAKWSAAFAALPTDQDDVPIVRRGMAIEEEEEV